MVVVEAVVVTETSSDVVAPTEEVAAGAVAREAGKSPTVAEELDAAGAAVGEGCGLGGRSGSKTASIARSTSSGRGLLWAAKASIRMASGALGASWKRGILK